MNRRTAKRGEPTMKRRRIWLARGVALTFLMLCGLLTVRAVQVGADGGKGGSGGGGGGFRSLKSATVPTPANLGSFVQDKTAAVQLGKALFWDMQAGESGQVSCASCHFHAGADNRDQNDLRPRGADRGVSFAPNLQLQP